MTYKKNEKNIGRFFRFNFDWQCCFACFCPNFNINHHFNNNLNIHQQLVDTLKALIENLKKQILELQAKIEAMRQVQTQVREQVQNIQDTLKDIRDLRKGMTSEEIKAIQQILASDPDIYPEGTISGYYGPLTEKALKRFREKHDIKDEDKEDRIG